MENKENDNQISKELQNNFSLYKRKLLEEDLGSYKRKSLNRSTTYEEVIRITSMNKLDLIKWCQDNELLSKIYICPKCNQPMRLCESSSKNTSSDGMVWKCRKRVDKRLHQVERSIRKGSFFENSNLTIEENLKMIYFWTQNISQQNAMHEMHMWSVASGNFSAKCREICVDLCMNNGDAIGGVGKEVEIDEKLEKENIIEVIM